MYQSAVKVQQGVLELAEAEERLGFDEDGAQVLSTVGNFLILLGGKGPLVPLLLLGPPFFPPPC
jgi:hypothetical protein